MLAWSDLSKASSDRFIVSLGNPMIADSFHLVSSYMVNSGFPHYSGSIECIDAMISAFSLQWVKEYSEIAAFKYLWRQGKKGDPAEDKAKAIWYTRFKLR